MTTLNLYWNPSALPAAQDGPGGCGQTHRLRTSVGWFKTKKSVTIGSGGQKHATVPKLFGVATYSETPFFFSLLPELLFFFLFFLLKTTHGDPETAGESSEVTKLPQVGPDETSSPYSTARNSSAAPFYSAT